MTVDEFTFYYVPAVLKLMKTEDFYNADGSHDMIKAYRAFAAKLGMSELWEKYHMSNPEDDKPMEPELRDLLIKFASPHGEVIFKAWQIRKGVINAEIY